MVKNNTPLISVVSPVYKAERIVEELIKRVKTVLAQITENYEIILVNDCSPDNSWEMIVQESEKEHRIKGINLSRNFGQHYAITAGLDYAKGDWVIVMDCDLQDSPEEISKLYDKAKEGWDIVVAKRVKRQDKLFKRLSSKLFNWIYASLSGIDVNSSTANFGIYHSQVINEYNKMPEVARSFPSLIRYIGFKSCIIDVRHSKRSEGASSYTFSKLFYLAGDVILSNSNKPLKICITLGFIMSIISFLMAFYNLMAYYFGLIEVPGFTTTVFSIWFIGGLMLTFIGIISLYIGKIFNQVKGRPLYIISEMVNIGPKNQWI